MVEAHHPSQVAEAVDNREKVEAEEVAEVVPNQVAEAEAQLDSSELKNQNRLKNQTNCNFLLYIFLRAVTNNIGSYHQCSGLSGS